MGGVSRFFVNLLNGRRNTRVYVWMASNHAIPDAASCLEIGCGNGDMARRIVDGFRPARYVATDLDARQIDTARRHLGARYPDGLPPTLELKAADMLALPFPSASFDAVFAFQSLHHADEHHHAFVNVPKALAEIDRVLRPGGRLAYTEIMNFEKLREWLSAHGYEVAARSNGWRRESVLAVKGSTARPSSGLP